MLEDNRIVVYDTTLRDGSQGEGLSFSVEDKLNLAKKLDEMLGLAYIEAGWPGSNPKDEEFFARAAAGELQLKNAKLSAFGSTRRANVLPEEDTNLRLLIAAKTPVITIFGKTWDLHVIRALGTTLEENLNMISDSVAYLKKAGREVVYDAEHFFDGYKANPDYALETLRQAHAAGADWIVLCDTNGGLLTEEVPGIISRVKETIPNARLGIHVHNDGDLACANTLTAVRNGAEQVQGTINGYGERCGNVSLCSVLPNLELKMGYQCLPEGNLKNLTEISRYVAEVANLSHNNQLPFVGRSAFAHKGGVHVDAVMKDRRTYEHIVPESVGNSQRVLISELSGQSNVLHKAYQLGLQMHKGDAEVKEVIEQIKQLENRGFHFENAEASIELIMWRTQPGYIAPFELRDMLVLSERRASSNEGLLSEATVKLQVAGNMLHTVADGNGPVNALDAALRKALVVYYPQLDAVRLTDYKVRVVNEDGTASGIRVTITSSDGHEIWQTVGSSTNVIEASWFALADSLEYALVYHLFKQNQPEASALQTV
ncbi:MAG: citramalate synthase [Chloroflexi bacterium]|uniref:Citramalate synthase n=1 Tax=Candidatus Chlorohelix allophototropha TaxID=3003348 RepID=A0A8T7M2U8_9CHLR|nr:citramalate synthase [Chloroflexota bacterium]WJW67469.1 citramalate synthase [Chloroflexota bacterium L227-S17]